jgi:uncharacterized protein (UPF0335 family)
MSNGPIASQQLRLFIERAERLKEEIKGLQADLRDVFAEAKGQGFDPKTMKEIIKLRGMDTHARREHEALLDTYKAALGMLDGTPLGTWAVERLSKPKTEPAENRADEPKQALEPAAEEEEAAPSEPELTVDDARRLGGEAARSGKPVTANPFPARDARRAAWDEAWCQELGTDGMDIPDALKPTPKPKKPEGEPKGGDE